MTPKIVSLNTQAVVVATAVGAIAALAMFWYHKRRKTAVPTIWEPVGKVKSLFIYPLKSGRRMELQTAQCTDVGFKLKTQNAPYFRDRCLIVYKESNNECKTARTYPKMLLISVTCEDQEHFNVTAPGMEKLKFKVPIFSEKCRIEEIVMWESEKVLTIDCGDEVARWFSRYILENPCGMRLGFHDGLHRRDIDKTHQQFLKLYSNLKNESLGMYSDLSSYMLMNQASVDDIAGRISTAKISMNQFRPNIVVEGEKIKPFAEDDWDWIKIGEVVFRNVKPCTRCSLTTIDPETGVKLPNNEPLKTLKTYRKVTTPEQMRVEGDSPVLGINMGVQYTGDIAVGDTVFLGKN